MMYKNWVSQTFFILFAFYFGFQLGPNLDLMQHYHNYLDFFGKSFFDRYSDFATLYLGKEPFHIVFKYILSRVELSSRVFCGCAAAIYATTFIYFIRQFKDFYTQKMGWLRTLVLLTLAVTVEFLLVFRTSILDRWICIYDILLQIHHHHPKEIFVLNTHRATVPLCSVRSDCRSNLG
ncbi:MAG: hypothetical protein L6U16_00720 [Porphyromonadaceae bacterium]|nr:MAG: hypothetical protein L6U16_00720 [Porphyromonadaceae bacterium]